MNAYTKRVGSRGSLLARRQAEMVIDRLRPITGDIGTLVIISTKGDRSHLPLHRIGTTGVFVKEIEEALTAGEIDLAVHSLKDMPSSLGDGLTIAAVLERADPRDALISRHLRIADLPNGTVVGTSSLRRKCQLIQARPDLILSEVRGNIDTRLAKLDRGEYGALLLASCGLDRLGLSNRISQRIDFSTMLPAACQGIIAIEARADDTRSIELARKIGDLNVMSMAEAERAFLAATGAGCQAPVGCLSHIRGDEIQIEGMIGREDGSSIIRNISSGPLAERLELGARLGEQLMRDGGAEIVGSIGDVV